MSTLRVAVVAFGGNALIRKDEPGFQKDQLAHADALARELLPFLQRGFRLLLVHGNGPQVGNSLIRMEESVTKVPELSLDACVAETEGSIGFFLEIAFRNLFHDTSREIATLFTTVEVAADDPRLVSPSKPIGPFYTPYRADYLVRMFDWDLVEDAGRGYRRVVASPRPVRILNAGLSRLLLEHADVLIAGGGGGVPVAHSGGRWRGIEAVIDKDYTAALYAEAVGAELFLILTAVDHVSRDHGTPRQQRIAEMTVADAERLLSAGQFPPGSMGPKIEAAVAFSRSTGGTVLITSVEALGRALNGEEGTRIIPGDDTTREE